MSEDQAGSDPAAGADGWSRRSRASAPAPRLRVRPATRPATTTPRSWPSSIASPRSWSRASWPSSRWRSAARAWCCARRGPSPCHRPPRPTASPAQAAAQAAPPPAGPSGTGSPPATVPEAAAGLPAVRAPLTGIFYGAPSPGSAPYVRVGGEVAVGQVIGLIEAMKLFNEIKSDLAGRVVRVVAETGQLVKARQPLIEVEPL